MIKSDIADIKNTGGRWGGAVTAAMFLKEFVGDTPWMHLDIAGTAWMEDSEAVDCEGPVRCARALAGGVRAGLLARRGIGSGFSLFATGFSLLILILASRRIRRQHGQDRL